MPKRRAPNISFLELAPNNRRVKVAMMLGWVPDQMTPDQIRVVDRVICHAAQVADQTMHQHVDTLLALIRK